LLAIAGGKDILIVSSDAWRVESQLEAHLDHTTGVAFSPDGKLLVSTGYDNVVRYWQDTGTGFRLHKGFPDSASGSGLSACPKGFAVWGGQGRIVVYGFEEPKMLGNIKVSSCIDVAITPDCKRVAIGTTSNVVLHSVETMFSSGSTGGRE
jgi:WD40 repeat protein